MLARVLLLLPVTLTLIPFPEMLLPMYFIAQSPVAAAAIFVLAFTISCTQMLYQYWAVGEVERLAPGFSSKAGVWLNRQALVQAVRRQTGLMLFLLGVCPGVRVAGTTLWRTSQHRWGGYLLASGAAVQLALMFGGMLATGRLISRLFR